MTTLLRPVEHAALHRLACACGSRCPDCGGRGAVLGSLAADEDDADYAIRQRRGRTRPARRAMPARPSRPAARPVGPTTHPGNPPLPARVDAQYRRTLTAMGWSGWRRPAGGRPVTIQDLEDFRRQGGVAPAQPRRPVDARATPAQRRRPRLEVTRRGRQMLTQPEFRHLSPLFQLRADGAPHHIYEIAPRGDLQQPLYIGKTAREPGIRLLEHLEPDDRSRVGRHLRGLRDGGGLRTVEVATGQFQVADRGRRSHLGEVLLQETHNPAWNDPSRHGFED